LWISNLVFILVSRWLQLFAWRPFRAHLFHGYIHFTIERWRQVVIDLNISYNNVMNFNLSQHNGPLRLRCCAERILTFSPHIYWSINVGLWVALQVKLHSEINVIRLLQCIKCLFGLFVCKVVNSVVFILATFYNCIT